MAGAYTQPSQVFSNIPLQPFTLEEEKRKSLWQHMKDMVKGRSEIEGMRYPPSSTSSYASSGDSSWGTTSTNPSDVDQAHQGPVEERLQNWMEANAREGAIRPRDWVAMLASPTYAEHRIKRSTWKKVGFIEGSNLIEYAFMHGRWVVTAFLHPVQAIIQRVWSAGADLLVQLSSPYTIPSLADPCFLWNPFKNAFSLLPSFSSILNVITLSYGVFGCSHAIVGIGSTSSNQLVIEVLVLDVGTSSAWKKLGELDERVKIHPDSDFVECNGSFYTYCTSPPQTFLEIKIDAPWIVYHQNMPKFARLPRLVVCCKSLFLVDTDNHGEHYKLWRFQPNCVESPWGLLLLHAPKLSAPLSIVSVKGCDGDIYFFYGNGETFKYSLEITRWFKIANCPVQPNIFPIIMEEPAWTKLSQRLL